MRRIRAFLLAHHYTKENDHDFDSVSGEPPGASAGALLKAVLQPFQILSSLHSRWSRMPTLAAGCNARFLSRPMSGATRWDRLHVAFMAILGVREGIRKRSQPMTQEDLINVRGLSLTSASSAAVERFDAIIDDVYYYRLGTQHRLDALLKEFPEFVLAKVLKGY
jgi:hypothetical protein